MATKVIYPPLTREDIDIIREFEREFFKRTGKHITLLIKLGVLSDTIFHLPFNVSSPELLIQCVSGFTSISVESIKGKSRLVNIVEARHICVCLLKSCGYNYPNISEIMGIDHTTAIHAVGVINNKLEVKDFFKDYCGDLVKYISEVYPLLLKEKQNATKENLTNTDTE